MRLNYKITGHGQPMILMHGVFGNLDNLNGLAKVLANHFQVIQVDLRNHGLSPWSDSMDYVSMANDIAELCQDLQLNNVNILGHSMGGKVAMKFADMFPSLINQIIVIDIAPVIYVKQTNQAVLSALNGVLEQNLNDKKQIISTMQSVGLPEATIQFLMKSFKNERWLINIQAITQNYQLIMSWQDFEPCLKPTLFICGGQSDYVTPDLHQSILAQFPKAKIVSIEGAGHNVHVEKPAEVLAVISDFLLN